MELMACVDGAVERTYAGAEIVTDVLEDAETEIACGLKCFYDFRSLLIDSYTKVLVCGSW